MKRFERSSEGPPVKRFERQFFAVAMWFLACRLRVMGGDYMGEFQCGATEAHSLEGSIRGMLDHEGELRLICAEQGR